MTFASDIAKFAAKTEQNLDQVRRGVFLQIASDVINRTPVDTGRARGNWQATINAPARGTTTSASQSAAIVQAQAIAQNAKGDQALYLTNNLPYIRRLEFGYSNQAPQGMLRLAVQNFRAALAKQLQAIDK